MGEEGRPRRGNSHEHSFRGKEHLAYSGSCRQFCKMRAKGAVGGPGHDRQWGWTRGDGGGLENGQDLHAVLKSSGGLRWPLIGWVCH